MSQYTGYWQGQFRMTFEEMSPDNMASWYHLETAGFDGWLAGARPLTFFRSDGAVIRAGSSMHKYDEGSVPHKLQSLVDPKAWARAFGFHDLMFTDHGWYEWNGTLWEYKQQEMHAVNEFLLYGAIATGCPVDEADAMFEGVNLGGQEIWDSHKGPFPCNPMLEIDRPPEYDKAA